VSRLSSLLVLTLASALFLLVALGMGLLISSIARNQFVAGQIAIVVTFLPAFILSGFVFDIRSMPTAIQVITHILPARYFVSILPGRQRLGGDPAGCGGAGVDGHGLPRRHAVALAEATRLRWLALSLSSAKSSWPCCVDCGLER
jgi:ABC-2 type transporter